MLFRTQATKFAITWKNVLLAFACITDFSFFFSKAECIRQPILIMIPVKFQLGEDKGSWRNIFNMRRHGMCDNGLG